MLDAARRYVAIGGTRRWVLLALLAGLVVVPSAEIGVFSGLPLDGGVEFVVALLVLPVMLSSDARRHWVSLVARLGVFGFRLALGVAAGALAVKVVLFVSDEHVGFRACYRSLVTVPDAPSIRAPADWCELSYDNPLSRYGVTRLDSKIDFVPGQDPDPAAPMYRAGQWNLDFFNSIRFNFYAWVDGVPDWSALPFAVVWEGEISEPSPVTYVVRYVGEATVTIGSDVAMPLAPSYAADRIERIEVPAGRHAVRIEYRFDRQLMRPNSPTGPYASMVLENADGTAVRSTPLDQPWRFLRAGVDAVTAALALSVGISLLVALRWKLLLAPIAGGIAYLGVRLPSIGPHIVGILEISLLVLGCALLRRRRSAHSTVLLTMFVAVVAIELTRAHHDFGSFDQVVLRPGGDDYLTYESQAHAVLGGSLRGEEDVFVYSPAFRYVLAIGHALVGNGDARLSVIAHVALSMAILAAATTWWARPSRRTQRLPIAELGTAAFASHSSSLQARP